MKPGARMSIDKVAVSRKQIGGEVPVIVNEITEHCLYTGLFGTLDSARTTAIIDQIITTTEGSNSKIIIVDLTNVHAIDSAVAENLTRMGKVLQLMNIKVIFCGIAGNLANTMVSAGIVFDSFEVARNLKEAVVQSFNFSGYTLSKDHE